MLTTAYNMENKIAWYRNTRSFEMGLPVYEVRYETLRRADIDPLELARANMAMRQWMDSQQMVWPCRITSSRKCGGPKSAPRLRRGKAWPKGISRKRARAEGRMFREGPVTGSDDVEVNADI